MSQNQTKTVNIDAALETLTAPHPHDLMKPNINGRQPRIFAIGGGKGGVGKSLISSNIAITLARTGSSVVAIDLDLGSANLHTALGIDPPKTGLSDYFRQPHAGLESILSPTFLPTLQLISGAQDALNVMEISEISKRLLIQQYRHLNVDYVVLDLGAGTHLNTIDFFLAADAGIVTVLPEPTSIENAYRFFKAAYFRKLLSLEKLAPIREKIMASFENEIKTPTDLYRIVNQMNPEMALALKATIETMSFKLMMNQVRTQADIDLGFSMKSVCKKYFGFELDYVGYLDYDSTVWQSVRRKRPLSVEFPTSRLVCNLEKIVQYLKKVEIPPSPYV